MQFLQKYCIEFDERYVWHSSNEAAPLALNRYPLPQGLNN